MNSVMKLNLLFLFFEKALKDFPFYYLFVLLFLWFRYLQKWITESCMYHSSEDLFETQHKTLKFQEKSEGVRNVSKEKSERKS